MIFGKENTDKKPDKEDVEVYLAKVNHYLDLLDKRIDAYHEKIRKVSSLIDLAAKRKEKSLLVRALQAKRRLKKRLEFYMGQQQDLRELTWSIQQTQTTEDYTKLMEAGEAIINKMKVAPEDIEKVKVGVSDTMTQMEESREIVSEPLGRTETEDLEEKADKLMAEKSLPKVEEAPEKIKERKEKEEARKEEEEEFEKLEEKLEDIL